MNNIDILFHDFLDYASKWKAGAKPDKTQYFTKKVYYGLWDHFFDLFLDGICPTAMQASLEYEKDKLLKQELTNDEVLEVILLEKLLYSFYMGDYINIAGLAQNFTSQQLQTDYAYLLQEFSKKDYGADARYSSKKVDLMVQSDMLPENEKEKYIQKCFLDIRRVVHTFLELKRIVFICRMLKSNIPREEIKKFTDADDKYLDIVSRFISENSGTIYYELIQNGCVVYAVDDKIDYDHLDFNESQILQILQEYFKV